MKDAKYRNLLFVMNELVDERLRQEQVHPGQDELIPEQWLPILVEEVGEVGKAIFERNYENKKGNYRSELIHVAATAVRAIQTYDFQREKTKEEKNEDVPHE